MSGLGGVNCGQGAGKGIDKDTAYQCVEIFGFNGFDDKKLGDRGHLASHGFVLGFGEWVGLGGVNLGREGS
jgi:hypothetical protein